MWANYHTHSNFCDGRGTPDEILNSAKHKHVLSIGLSSHAPLPFPKPWCMKANQLKDYFLTIDHLKKSHSGIEIACGLEVDYVPNQIGPADLQSRLDYTIGSIHFVDALPDGTPWEVDGAADTFQQGFNSIFGKNARAAISRYFELTREMITRSTPDIVGHLDKIKIQNKNNSLFQESESWYRAEVRQTLRQIREAGCVLEVNTRGLYQQKTVDPYPSPWVLAQAHELGLPVTLSSDAHHPDQLTCQFNETAAILYEIGFRHLMVWYTGRWQLVSFNPNGIQFSELSR